MIKYLSWDLQGTLSASEFSDNFWLMLLPSAYAAKHGCDLVAAKAQLWDQFKTMGKYDINYYDDAYWAEQLDFTTIDILREAVIQPSLNEELIDYLTNIELPSIILSTTTETFINYELGTKRSIFAHTYSCVDDFQTGGKTKEIYLNVARMLGIEPNEMLHIGDNMEMDSTNATQAGVHSIHYDGNTQTLIDTLRHMLREENGK